MTRARGFGGDRRPRRRGRRTVALSVVTLVVASVTACGGGAPGPTGAGTSPVGTATGSTSERPLEGVVVAVDPGHNRDNGASPETSRDVDAGGFTKPCNTTGTAAPDGRTESRHNWELAERLAARLRDLGAEVPMTRQAEAGWGPCVDERGRFPAEHGADLMVSLHADGSDGSDDAGFHVIRPGDVPGWTDDVVVPSAQLAREVRDALVTAGFTPSSYAGRDGMDVRTDLGTLNWSDVPVVLVESHNMRHPDDEALMRSPSGQERFAEAVAAAVVAFTRASR